MQTAFKAMDSDHPRIQVETFQRTLFAYHLGLGQDREHQAEVPLESMVGHSASSPLQSSFPSPKWERLW